MAQKSVGPWVRSCRSRFSARCPQLSALRELFAAWAHWPVLKQHDQRSLRPPTPRKQTGSFRRKLGDFGTCTRGRARYKTIAIRPRRLGSNGFAGGCWPSQAGLSVLSFCQNASCHFVNRAAVGLFWYQRRRSPARKARSAHSSGSSRNFRRSISRMPLVSRFFSRKAACAAAV